GRQIRVAKALPPGLVRLGSATLRLALFVLGEHRDARVDGSHQFGLLAADPVRQPRQSRVELLPEPDPLFKKKRWALPACCRGSRPSPSGASRLRGATTGGSR